MEQTKIRLQNLKTNSKFRCWGDVCLVRVVLDNNRTRLPIQFGIRVRFLRVFFLSPFLHLNSWVWECDRITTAECTRTIFELIVPHCTEKFWTYKWYSRIPKMESIGMRYAKKNKKYQCICLFLFNAIKETQRERERKSWIR